jgi:hypothetical protein
MTGHFEDHYIDSGCNRRQLLVCSLGTRDDLLRIHLQTTKGTNLAEKGCKRWCLTPDDNPLVPHQSTSR